MGAGTWESHHAISNLMFRYAECVDLADFDGLSELFVHGTMRSTSAEDSETGMTGEQVGRFYAATNRVHEDGTLRTRHLSTNVRIDIDEHFTPSYDPNNMGLWGTYIDNPFSWEDDWNRGMQTLAVILLPGKAAGAAVGATLAASRAQA